MKMKRWLKYMSNEGLFYQFTDRAQASDDRPGTDVYDHYSMEAIRSVEVGQQEALPPLSHTDRSFPRAIAAFYA